MKFLRIVLWMVVPVLLLATLLFLTVESSSYKVYVIHTGSMSPTIPPGSAVLVHKGHYHKGQVITFTVGGLTVTHRLVGINAEGFTVTKGDANRSDDPWHVPTNQIIGGVVMAPRDVGYWIVFFKSPLGIASALLTIVCVWQLWSIAETNTEDSPASASTRRRFLRRRASDIEVADSAEGAIASSSPPEAELVVAGAADPGGPSSGASPSSPAESS